MTALLTTVGAETGDAVLIIADTVKKHVLTTLGALRLEVANRLQIERSGYNLLWITEFPFFEYDEEAGQYVAMHHPFTSPLDECIPYLDSAPEKVFAKAYDLVLTALSWRADLSALPIRSCRDGCSARWGCPMRRHTRNSAS